MVFSDSRWLLGGWAFAETSRFHAGILRKLCALRQVGVFERAKEIAELEYVF